MKEPCFCVLCRFTFCPYNSHKLILHQTKSKDYEEYIQDRVLRERKQGKERNCPYHGTCDHQWDYRTVQLQADHPESTLECKVTCSLFRSCPSCWWCPKNGTRAKARSSTSWKPSSKTMWHSTPTRISAASLIPIGLANMHKFHPRSNENHSMKGFYQEF